MSDLTAITSPATLIMLSEEHFAKTKLASEQLGLTSAWFNNTQCSDVTLHYGDRSLYAHKMVLSAASPYFSAVFEGRFAEADAREVVLYDDEPAAIESLIMVIYGLQPLLAEGESEVRFLMDLRDVAGKYQMEDLAVELFEWIEIILWAMERDTTTGWEEWMDAAHHVYEQCADHKGRLQRVISKIWGTHRVEFHAKPDAKELLLRTPGLAFDLMKMAMAAEVETAQS